VLADALASAVYLQTSVVFQKDHRTLPTAARGAAACQ
jgi:hypothetical protein